MLSIHYSTVTVGAEFVDLTYGALWRKLANGQAECVCGAGQYAAGAVKSFSPHFLVELEPLAFSA